jgi:uncharacterized protein with GYD domain
VSGWDRVPKETVMPTYLTLLRYTDQGIRNIKESPARLEAAKKVFQAAGGELKAFYLTLGRYDAFCIGECPNDEVATKIVLTLGSLGNVRTETTRIFNEAEYRKVIGSI